MMKGCQLPTNSSYLTVIGVHSTMHAPQLLSDNYYLHVQCSMGSMFTCIPVAYGIQILSMLMLYMCMKVYLLKPTPSACSGIFLEIPCKWQSHLGAQELVVVG